MVAFGLVVFVVVIAIVILALVFIHVVSEFHRMDYGPWFVILWMKLVRG